MKNHLQLFTAALALGISSQAFSWETSCSYGSFEEDRIVCTVSSNYRESNSTNIYYRSGDDNYTFSQGYSSQYTFSEGSAVEIKLDDGEIEPLGEIVYTSSFGGRSTEPYSVWNVKLPASEGEELIQRMKQAQVLRIRVYFNSMTEGENKEMELYNEVPLFGFSDAASILERKTL